MGPWSHRFAFAITNTTILFWIFYACIIDSYRGNVMINLGVLCQPRTRIQVPTPWPEPSAFEPVHGESERARVVAVMARHAEAKVVEVYVSTSGSDLVFHCFVTYFIYLLKIEQLADLQNIQPVLMTVNTLAKSAP